MQDSQGTHFNEVEKYLIRTISFMCVSNRITQVTILEEQQFKIINFHKEPHRYLIHTRSVKSLKGTIVNRTDETSFCK